MKKVPKILWNDAPEKHDYPAAQSYLSLIFDRARVDTIVEDLRTASISEFKSKDIFRASGLSLLGVSNFHVKKDREKIKKAIALDPILLVRDRENKKVIIADGYHRLCAVYQFDEDAIIPCKII